jgi:hypothetical protein
MAEKNMIKRTSAEVLEYKAMVEKAKRDAEVVTLRVWYDTTENHSDEIKAYMDKYKQLGRLGKELHKRNVPRVTERYGDSVRTLVEATYCRIILDFSAPLCALSCLCNINDYVVENV